MEGKPVFPNSLGMSQICFFSYNVLSWVSPGFRCSGVGKAKLTWCVSTQWLGEGSL